MRLNKDLEAKLLEMESKIKGETNIGVFTKDEKLVIESAYYVITARFAPKNCNGLCASVLKILRNWFTWYVENTPAETIEPEAVDLNDLTKAKIKELYPNATGKTKAELINSIEYGE